LPFETDPGLGCEVAILAYQESPDQPTVFKPQLLVINDAPMLQLASAGVGFAPARMTGITWNGRQTSALDAQFGYATPETTQIDGQGS